MNRITNAKTKNPLKILQYGEGNFLRAFVDYMVDGANKQNIFNGNIKIVKAIPFGNLEKLQSQNNNYTVILRGIADSTVVNEKTIITSVEDSICTYTDYLKYAKLAECETLEFIVSNTTEAGIVYDETDKIELNPPNSFPGKLTKFLFDRYKFFNGDSSKGLIILPVELIDKNGTKLKECVEKLCTLWNLEQDFIKWISSSIIFCNTLVDRIVTGYPFDEAELICKDLGYKDEMIVTAEPFGLWVIETEKADIVKEKFPIHKAGYNVVITNDMKHYKEQKVKLLNGGHTSTIMGAYLCGHTTVLDCMKDPLIKKYLKTAMFDEIAQTVNLPIDQVNKFANSVIERFENPFIKHKLLDISLNSTSKWRARVLPSLKDYFKINGKLPKVLTFSFAAYIYFYIYSFNKDSNYKIFDDESILDFYNNHSFDKTSVENTVHCLMINENFWGEDLTKITDFEKLVVVYLNNIKNKGMKKSIEELLS